MATLSSSKLRETFILRVWRETGESNAWRGQVQCVSSGEVMAFQNISTLFDYIKTQLDEQEPQQTGQGLR